MGHSSYVYVLEAYLNTYECLLMSLICGDQTLFMHCDEAEIIWRFIDPILKRWKAIKRLIPFMGIALIDGVICFDCFYEM
ncbi:hypothetical protein [Bartonella sp. B17]